MSYIKCNITHISVKLLTHPEAKVKSIPSAKNANGEKLFIFQGG